MVRYCQNCGSPLRDNAKFCGKCGTSLPIQTPVQPAYAQPPVQQPSNQPQYPASPQKKSNGKIIAAILAVSIIAAIICAVLFFTWFQEDSDNDTILPDEQKLIGTWDMISITVESNGETQTFDGDDNSMSFNSDHTATSNLESTSQDTWELKNGQICVTSIDSTYGYDEQIQCMDYNFSDDDKTLTLSYTTTYEDSYGIEQTMRYTILLNKKTTFNGEGEETDSSYDFLGAWEQTSDDPYSSYNQTWTFYSNGSVKMEAEYSEYSTSTSWATYQIKNNQLCLTYIYVGDEYEMCYDYQFSGNKNNLSITYYSELTYTFTKI